MTTAGEARALAWEIIRRVEETGAFADALIGVRLPASGLDVRDQALVTRLVYGTLAWRGFLDRAIETFSGRRVAALEPPIRILLELTLLQLFKFDKIPAYAAVDRAVELAKTYRRGRATRLVNAVLRRAAAEGEGAVALPDAARAPAAHLAARYSHPLWLVERWMAESGREATEALLRANNEPAPSVLRVNRRRTTRGACLARLAAAGIAAAPTAMAPDGIAIAGSLPAAVAAGDSAALSVQGEASQLAALLVDPQPGDRVLDGCAGVGGKATYLAELMGDRGMVLAVDRHRRAVRRLVAEAGRLGLSNILPLAGDATCLPLAAGRRFDRILLDAPCSGLGTLRQHPELRWRCRPADVTACAGRQRRLLGALLQYLRPGGVLVYATCTIVREENEEVVERVVGTGGEVQRLPAGAVLPPEAMPAVDAGGALRTLPHVHGVDGFFAVLLKRR